ncbi:hypothetical protein [Bacillus haynesii]|nr:hypothetical protein [Bacillus haynesii]
MTTEQGIEVYDTVQTVFEGPALSKDMTREQHITLKKERAARV